VLLVRRTKRRIKGAVGAAIHFFSTIRKWLIFRCLCIIKGVPTKYLWRAFSYLASLDMDEPMVTGEIGVYGCGYFVEIKDAVTGAHFTIQQTGNGKLQAYEWREKKNAVGMEYGALVNTNWWEIYNTGKRIDVRGVNRLLSYLKMLYGTGPVRATRQEAAYD